MKIKYIILIFIISFIILSIFFIRIYTSSPGFVSEESAKIFFKNSPKCKGINFPLDKEATYSDAPGRSVCFGLLSK